MKVRYNMLSTGLPATALRWLLVGWVAAAVVMVLAPWPYAVVVTLWMSFVHLAAEEAVQDDLERRAAGSISLPRSDTRHRARSE